MSTASNNPIDIGLFLLPLIIDGTNHRSTEGSAATIWTFEGLLIQSQVVMHGSGDFDDARPVFQGFTIEQLNLIGSTFVTWARM